MEIIMEVKPQAHVRHCHGNRKLLPGHVTQIYFNVNIFGDNLRW